MLFDLLIKTTFPILQIPEALHETLFYVIPSTWHNEVSKFFETGNGIID